MNISQKQCHLKKKSMTFSSLDTNLDETTTSKTIKEKKLSPSHQTKTPIRSSYNLDHPSSSIGAYKCYHSSVSLVRNLNLLLLALVIVHLSADLKQQQVKGAWTGKLTEESSSKLLHHHDDLIEGRLDTGQLCGRRFIGTEQNNNINNNNLFYIVGGDEVEDDQFWPWSVAIYELDPLNGQKAFICSGSLISDKFILTAAHCIQQSRFDTLTEDEIFLKIASVRLDDHIAPFYRVESVYVHPEYIVDRKANDIALLKLMRGQRLPARARPICLPSHVANRIDFTDQQVTIIGWGKTSAMEGNEPTRLIDAAQMITTNEVQQQEDYKNNSKDARSVQANDTLLQAEVRVTSTDQCNRNYSRLEISWLNIDEHFLCARDPQGKRDACQGDSGGPLMWNNQQDALESAKKWYQIGLVSFGHGCANSHFPGVYTRISYYMSWILKIVNGRHN